MNHWSQSIIGALILNIGVQAQVSYTGGVYSQNFDTMPGVPNNTINVSWVDNTTLPGWYANKTTFSITDGTIGGAAATFDDTSLAENVGLFSFGGAILTDRALGSRATSSVAGNDPILYGVRLVNGTSHTLTKFTITYTGEQWLESSSGHAHSLSFDYQLSATNMIDGVWTPVTSATFTAPISNGPEPTALVGSVPGNQSVLVGVVSAVEWTPGQELWLRFRDNNESGREQGLGVDDFSFLADNETGLFLNSSSSYVSMGNGPQSATAFGAADFTVECRFLRTGNGIPESSGAGGVTAVPLIAKCVAETEGDSRDGNYFLGINADGKLVADFEQYSATNNGIAYAAGQNFPVVGSTTLHSGVWYHVAATYETSTGAWKLYVDGVAESISVPSGSPQTFPGVTPRYDSIQGLGIGTTIDSSGANYGNFQGIISEARIWNIARTGGQILANKDRRILSGQAGMIARFGLNDGLGTSAVGTTAEGGSTPVGVLSGTILPVWVNAKDFASNSNLPPVVTAISPVDEASGIGESTSVSAIASDPEGAGTTVTFYGRKTTPLSPGPDFTIVAIPDTQYYSENMNIYPAPPGTGANISYFNAQTDWIRDHRISRNIAFVSHMGDIVNNGDFSGNPAEWIRADSAMKTIENQSATLRAYGIPWGVAPGNHDIGTGDGTGTTMFYNQYFGTSRFAGRNYYGGNFGTNNNNNFQFFSASGLDFIIIHLEYNAGPLADYQSTLDWADALLKAYPNRRAIITSHYILNTGNPALFSPQGQNIYNELKDNPNLFLMLCGHIHGEGRRTDTFEGRVVHSVLQNYQEGDNGGNGFLRTFTLSPTNNHITAEMYSPSLNRLATIADVSTTLGTFTMEYEMQTPVANWIPIGTVDLVPGETVASLAWTGLERGSRYEWYASASDGTRTTAGSASRFATISPTLPSVSLVRPFDRAVYVASSSVSLAANVVGQVSRVEFFSDNTKLGEALSPPYEFTWVSPPLGSHRLTALAVMSSGDATLSNVVSVNMLQQGASDTDGDSIPDEYEIAHNLNPLDPADAGLDSDGDGLTNLKEFIFGTAAEIPDRYAINTMYHSISGTNTISFPTIPGRSYRVMYGDTLLSWQAASGAITGTGATIQWTDDGVTTGSPPSAGLKRFYRIEVTVVP